MTELSTIHQRLFFVPSHEILFSRVCGPLLRERETGFTAKSAPGTGCWLCNMNVEDCRRARKAVQQGEKKDGDERGVRSSLRGWLSSLYHITIPNVSPGLCETFCFFFFILYYLRAYIYIVQYSMQKQQSLDLRISYSLRSNLFSRPREKNYMISRNKF